MESNPLALVTGATSGIGLELARIHAMRGGDLVLVARSEDTLLSLQREWERRYKVKVYPIALDLSLPGSAEILTDKLTSLKLSPQYLVNNAGLGGPGEFLHQTPSQIDQQMMVNMVALTHITRAFLPAMVASKRGSILQVASLASFMPGPLHAVYYASKAYVLSFSEALRFELQGSGVTVTTLCPGPTESNFLAVAGGPSANVYRAQSARQVAEYGYQSMMAGRSIAIPEPSLAWKIKCIPKQMLSRITHKRNRKILASVGLDGAITKFK
jgi:short-subunit dehydrogenase